MATVLALVATGCGIGAADRPPVTFPPQTFGPGATVGPEVAVIRAEIARLLGERGIVLRDTSAAFRPAESAELAAAPRAVVQALLPADPNTGFISLYSFRDPDEAARAAQSQNAFLSAGPGRVLAPQGTAHVIRQAGATVVYYSWLPAAARDPSTPDVAAVLTTIGIGHDIVT
jgi:hypothetical protein